jgi:hypothetical protein
MNKDVHVESGKKQERMGPKPVALPDMVLRSPHKTAAQQTEGVRDIGMDCGWKRGRQALI